MSILPRAASFFALVLILVCTNSHSGPNDSKLIDTHLVYGNAQIGSNFEFLIDLKLFEDSEFAKLLNQPEENNPVSLTSSEILYFDCKSLSENINYKNEYIFMGIDEKMDSAVKVYKCMNINDSIKGIVLINLQSLAKEGAENNKLFMANQIFQIFLEKFSANIKIFSLCGEGFFDVHGLRCLRNKYKRTSQDLLNEYTILIAGSSNNYPSAINTLCNNTEVDQSFYSQMVSDLIEYTTNSDAVINYRSDSCLFQTVSDAISCLMASNYKNSSSMDALFDLLIYGVSTVPINTDCNQNPNSPFDPISTLIGQYEIYLEFYKSSLVGVSSVYDSKISNVDLQINNLVIAYLQNGHQPSPTYGSFSSNTPALTGKEPKIYVFYSLDNGSVLLPTCTCSSFCGQTSLTIEARVQYANLGYYADITSLNYYRTGDFSTNYDPNTNSPPATTYSVVKSNNTVINGCFSNNITQNTAIMANSYTWLCEISGYTQSCATPVTNNFLISYLVTSLGIFEPVPCLPNCSCTTNDCNSCKPNYVYTASTSVSAASCTCPSTFYVNGNSCEPCGTNCSICSSANLCTTCSSYYTYNWNGNCSCPPATFDSGLSCTNCSSHCSNCSSVSECTLCTSNYLLIGGNCICTMGTYDSGSGCSSCSSHCASCSNSSACAVCSSNYLLTNGTCSCGLGFYESGLYCEPCSSHCNKCSSATVCIDCASNYSLISGKCSCNSGFFDSGTSCLNCPNNCNNCSSLTSCLTCSGNFSVISGNCACPTGYFATNTSCLPCPSNCSACLSNSICTACIGNYYLSSVGTCECAMGTYGTVSGCSNCSANCYFCLSLSHCIVCLSNYSPINGMCSCSAAKFDSGSACIGCSSNCLNCTSTSECTLCASNYQLIGGQCICTMGTYDSGSGCSSCSSHCASCSNSSACAVCSSNYSLTNGICSCGLGFYSSGLYCEPCPAHCNNCSSATVCIDCASNYSLISGKCSCNSGFFDSGNSCLNCPNHCNSCSSLTSCNSCSGNYSVINGICSCPTGFYGSGNSCLSCSSYCTNCSSLSLCYSCSSNFSLINGYCSCPSGYIATSTLCAPCPSNCAVCTSSSHCTTCISNYTLNSMGACACGSGYYGTLSGCFNCSSHCNTCSSASSCSSCSSPYSLTNGICSCGSGKFDSGFSCISCSNHCTNCSSLSSCTLCASNYTLTNGNCSCGTGYYDSGSSCSSCSSHCNVCSSKSTCTLCSSNYSLTSGACSCGAGFYDSGLVCANCPNHCATCSSSSLCKTCSSNYIIINGLCSCALGKYDSGSECLTCSSHCSNCSSASLCYSCSGTYSLINGLCGCSAKKYDTGSGCANCGLNCAQCTSISSCNDCSYYTNNNNGTCSCPYKTYDNQQACVSCGQNCNVCSNSSACLICANTFVNNNNGTCSCPSNSYLSNGQCILCVANCQSCDSTGCLACNPSFILTSPNVCTQAYRYIQPSEIVSVSFDSTFSYINVVFNTSLYSASGSGCNNYIVNTQTLGSGAICGFNSDTVLRVTLGIGFTVTSSTTLYLVNTLTTKQGTYYLNPVASIPVQPVYSVQPSAPIPVINGPSVISAQCSETIITFTSYGSSGLASKTFSYEWSTNLVIGLDLVVTDGYAISYLVSAVISSFQVTLKITNSFGISASTTFPVTVINTQTLFSIALSPVSETLYYSNPITLQGQVVNTCDDTGIVKYYWVSPSGYSSKANIYKNILNVPSKTIPGGTYTFSLTATLQLSSDYSIVINSNLVKSTITIIETFPVAVMSKTSSEIALTYNQFSISGASSYDPDGSNIVSYDWSTTIPGVSQSGSSKFFTLYRYQYETYSVFTVTLTVANAGGLTDSTSATFTVIQNGYIDISIPFDNQKVPAWKSLRLTSVITMGYGLSESSVFLLWTEIDGPVFQLSHPTSSFLVIPEFTFQQGQTYYFQLTGTTLGISNSATVEVKVNLGAACLGSAIGVPSLGRVRRTIYTFAIDGCIDLDNQDYPLYTSLYYTYQGRVYLLLLNSKASVFYAIANVPFTFAITFVVLDSLGDGRTYTSPYVTATLGRMRELKSEDLAEFYKIDVQMFDPFMVFNNFLASYTLDFELLDLIWDDFTEYIQIHEDQLDKLKLTNSIILMFMNEEQKESINYERISKYSRFLCGILKNLKHIDNKEMENISFVVEKILEHSFEAEYLEIANEILKNLVNFSNNPFQAPYVQNTAFYNLYVAEKFVSDFNKVPIILDNIEVIISETNSEKYDLAKVELVYYKNENQNGVISVNFNVFRKYESHMLDHKLNKNEFPAENIYVKMPLLQNDDLTCAELIDNQWVAEKCIFYSVTNSEATIKISKSGVFSLITRLRPEKINPFIIHYIFASISIISAILISVIFIFNKNSAYIEPAPTCRSGTSLETERLDFENKSQKKRFVSANEFFSLLLKNNSQNNIRRAILLMLSRIAIEISIQSQLLQNTDLNSVLIGLLSVLILLPVAIVCELLIKSSNFKSNYIGWTIQLLTYVASFACLFFVTTSPQWSVSLIVGLFAEIFMSQSLLPFINYIALSI